jgi:hypothetical protein
MTVHYPLENHKRDEVVDDIVKKTKRPWHVRVSKNSEISEWRRASRQCILVDIEVDLVIYHIAIYSVFHDKGMIIHCFEDCCSSVTVVSAEAVTVELTTNPVH